MPDDSSLAPTRSSPCKGCMEAQISTPHLWNLENFYGYGLWWLAGHSIDFHQAQPTRHPCHWWLHPEGAASVVLVAASRWFLLQLEALTVKTFMSAGAEPKLRTSRRGPSRLCSARELPQQRVVQKRFVGDTPCVQPICFNGQGGASLDTLSLRHWDDGRRPAGVGLACRVLNPPCFGAWQAFRGSSSPSCQERASP